VTAFFAVHGHSYTGEVVPFGETVFFKTPTSGTGLRRGGRKFKGDTAWQKGIWVGKTDHNDEHEMLTPEGRFTARTVRRLAAGKRHDKELFEKVKGLPWQERLLTTKRQSRIEVVPTPVEQIDVQQVQADAAPSAPPVPAETAETHEKGSKRKGNGEDQDQRPTGPRSTTDPVSGALPPSAPLPAPSAGETGSKRKAEEGSEQGDLEDDDGDKVMNVTRADAAGLHENPDYSCLTEIEELDWYNKSFFDSKDVMEGKVVGLNLLDEFQVYDVAPKAAAFGKKKVDTKWEISMRAGALKCRLVGREFKTLEDRDDLFAPGSTASTSRMVDYLALKDDDDIDDPIVKFIGDMISAY